MKRHLLLAALIATPLYLRQREVEKRQREWRKARDAELRRYAAGLNEELTKYVESASGSYERFAKEVNRAFQRAGRP